MEARTHQHRVVQKRLLMRFKDRSTAQPLGNLDALLQLTYEGIVQLAETIEDAERALKVVSQHLRACTQLILLLIQYRFDLESADVLRSYFSYVEDNQEQGWEEVCDLSLDHLLKTILVASNQKDKGLYIGNSGATLTMPPDLGKLRKRITTVIDRLAAGVRFQSAEDVEMSAGGGGGN